MLCSQLSHKCGERCLNSEKYAAINLFQGYRYNLNPLCFGDDIKCLLDFLNRFHFSFFLGGNKIFDTEKMINETFL